MAMIRVFFGIGLLALCVIAIGCGGDSASDLPPTHKVTGNVTLDGKPVAKGEIIFESEQDAKEGRPPGTGEIKDGKYEANVYAGKTKVKISAQIETGPKDATGEAPTEESIPAKYNEQTTLEFEVKEGENKKDFDLKS
jgi:hypothetical protein